MPSTCRVAGSFGRLLVELAWRQVGGQRSQPTFGHNFTVFSYGSAWNCGNASNSKVHLLLLLLLLFMLNSFLLNSIWWSSSDRVHIRCTCFYHCRNYIAAVLIAIAVLLLWFLLFYSLLAQCQQNMATLAPPYFWPKKWLVSYLFVCRTQTFTLLGAAELPSHHRSYLPRSQVFSFSVFD